MKKPKWQLRWCRSVRAREPAPQRIDTVMRRRASLFIRLRQHRVAGIFPTLIATQDFASRRMAPRRHGFELPPRIALGLGPSPFRCPELRRVGPAEHNPCDFPSDRTGFSAALVVRYQTEGAVRKTERQDLADSRRSGQLTVQTAHKFLPAGWATSQAQDDGRGTGTN